MPPYLIGNEAKTLYPFSASNEATWSHHRRFTTSDADLEGLNSTSPNWVDLIGIDQHPSSTYAEMPNFSSGPMDTIENTLATHNSVYHPLPFSSMPQAPVKGTERAITCWEILTVRLGQYVKDQMAQGLVPTDDQLQKQARFLLYEDDDSWNQTAADNQEWLQLFKKAHNLPSTATDARVDLDEDLGGRLAELNFDAYLNDTNGTWDSATLGQEGMFMDMAHNIMAPASTLHVNPYLTSM